MNVWMAYLVRAIDTAGRVGAEEWFCAPSRTAAFALAEVAFPGAVAWEIVMADVMRSPAGSV